MAKFFRQNFSSMCSRVLTLWNRCSKKCTEYGSPSVLWFHLPMFNFLQSHIDKTDCIFLNVKTFTVKSNYKFGLSNETKILMKRRDATRDKIKYASNNVSSGIKQITQQSIDYPHLIQVNGYPMHNIKSTILVVYPDLRQMCLTKNKIIFTLKNKLTYLISLR